MNLADVFKAVAHKELAAVELPDRGSNQHELNGVAALKEVFGTQAATRGVLAWRFFADDVDPVRQESEFTFYDARAKGAAKTGRSEWRLYYRGGFLGSAKVGDLFILAKTCDEKVYGLVFRRGSVWQRGARALFGISGFDEGFRTLDSRSLGSQDVELLQRQILEELELGDLLPTARSDLDLMREEFGDAFPAARRVSQFARAKVEVDVMRSDLALTRWIEREEQLFRALENALIKARLDQGFQSVDSFIAYSLSVQNRRKSRMGLALQDHLAELFARRGLRFSAQATTEGNNRPDFIFPGEREYRDRTFKDSLLVMLGVKSTAKDRWRQVLTEADRISSKHLCTLEPGISSRQTDEMNRQQLTLVVPEGLHSTYTAAQKRSLMSVEEFIAFVAGKQRR